MGRPRKRHRVCNRAEHEVGIDTMSNGLGDTMQGAVASDTSNIDLDSSTAQTSRTVDEFTRQTSMSLGSPHTERTSLDFPDDWGLIQSSNNSGPTFAATGQNGLLLHEGPNPITASERGIVGQSPFQNVDQADVPCSCLKELYSVLMSFQSLPSPSFPSSRGPLTEATNLARKIVRCQVCPQDYPSALQNFMLLGTLIPLIAHGYSQLLKHIQEQAAQGNSITYRIGDSSLTNAHLHTGTLDCPMGFNVELDSDEWTTIARKVLKQDIYGNSQSIDCLLSVVEELEQRQHLWHLLQPFRTNPPTAPCRHQQLSDPSQHGGMCTQLIAAVRRAIDAIDL